MNRFFRIFDAALRRRSAPLAVAVACAIALATWFSWPVHAQRTASNPLGAQLNVQDAGTCSTSNSFAWQTLPTNAGTTTLNLSGTFTATVTVRESNNGGATWSTAATLTTTGTTTYATNGFTDFCADVTAFTSGIVQVSIATGLQQVIPGSSALAGTNGQLLFNNNGVFGATSGLTWNSANSQVLAPNGTPGNPSYSFSGATGAGMFLLGTTPVIAQNGSGILIVGNPSIFSFALQINGHVGLQAANSDFAGKLACATSTATKTFSSSYTSTPAVVVFDETTKGGANLTAISNSAFTVSCTGATDALDYIVIGNPN